MFQRQLNIANLFYFHDLVRPGLTIVPLLSANRKCVLSSTLFRRSKVPLTLLPAPLYSEYKLVRLIDLIPWRSSKCHS